MNAPFLIDQTRVDPRLALLARAAARFELVQSGAMDLGEAFDGLVAGLQCACDCDLIHRWERDFPGPVSQCRVTRPSAAPRSTFDALVLELRTHGLPQLSNTSCRRRLGKLSTQQVRELIAALMQLRPEYSAITEELILKLGDCL
jgi:hypothetical protein